MLLKFGIKSFVHNIMSIKIDDIGFHTIRDGYETLSDMINDSTELSEHHYDTANSSYESCRCSGLRIRKAISDWQIFTYYLDKVWIFIA